MKKYLKILLIISSILGLFVISELLYIYNNSDLRMRSYINLAKFTSQIGGTQISLNFLTEAANLLINDNKKKYGEQIPENFASEFSLNDNKNLKNDFNLYIRNLYYLYPTSRDTYNFSRIFYDLALIAFKNDADDLTLNLLQYAYYISPNTSFWAVELANYYYFERLSTDALEILEKCIKLQAPKKHCQDYWTHIKSQSVANTPGFLLKETEEYYESPSLLKNLSNF